MSRELRARALLAELDALGLTVEDLAAARSASPTAVAAAAPTVAEYLGVVAASYGRATAQTYGTYWRLLVAVHGDRPVRSIGYDDCVTMLAAAARRRTRGAGAAPGELRRRPAGLLRPGPAVGADAPNGMRSRQSSHAYAEASSEPEVGIRQFRGRSAFGTAGFNHLVDGCPSREQRTEAS